MPTRKSSKKKPRKDVNDTLYRTWLRESKQLRDDGYLSKADIELMHIWFEAGYRAALRVTKGTNRGRK